LGSSLFRSLYNKLDTMIAAIAKQDTVAPVFRKE
jgi:hypothetical protein